MAEPRTTVGISPDDPTRTVELPFGALDAGCYVAGSETHLQTALLHSWCVEWAEAGAGFCYLHPRGPEPYDLLARLPADRLDDVVWIDVDRMVLPPELDIPWLRRVSIDLFELLDGRHELDAVDPIDIRVNAYLDAMSVHPHWFDWNVARVLSATLPALFLRDNLQPYNPPVGISLPGLNAARERNLSDGVDAPVDRDLDIARYAVTNAQKRASDPADDARSLIGWAHDNVPTNPLLESTSYDIADALTRNHIVLVTGNLQSSNAEVRIRTHLLVAALCCRLLEVGYRSSDLPTFPLVIDGAADLIPGDGEIFRRLLREATALPTAPVVSGPSISELADPFGLTVSRCVDTVVSVDDTAAPNSGTDNPEKTDLSSLRRIGSLDAVERYLDREATDAMPEGPLCWLRTNQAGRIADVETLRKPDKPAIAPSWPAPQHDLAKLEETLTRSLERHGVPPTYMPDSSEEKARERLRDPTRQRK